MAMPTLAAIGLHDDLLYRLFPGLGYPRLGKVNIARSERHKCELAHTTGFHVPDQLPAIAFSLSATSSIRRVESSPAAAHSAPRSPPPGGKVSTDCLPP